MPTAPLPAALSLGLDLPTPAYFAGVILFSIIGWAAARHGKRTGHPRRRWLGWALMLFPYVVGRTWMLYTFGAALCAAMWL